MSGGDSLGHVLMLAATAIIVLMPTRPGWQWVWLVGLGLGALQAIGDPYWVWLGLGILVPLKLILIWRERQGLTPSSKATDGRRQT